MRLSDLWAILYAMLIIGLSSIPGKSLPDLGWFSHNKLIHIAEYTIFGLLVSRAMVFRVPARGQVFLFALLIAGTFGALDETYQALIPGRDSSYGDWVADIVGVASGSSLYLLWKFYRDQAPAG
ncbi:MAG: hypothetical protein GH143_00095 [Calditrichaeota bacterium]|nr:hypothetical protein [Calditrichota bacterium]